MIIKRVAIMCGGRSSEHEISCISAQGVLGAIDRSKFEPIVIGIRESDGAWFSLDLQSPFGKKSNGLPCVENGAPVDLRTLGVDVVFPLLHGPYGEDGTIQGLCEMMNIPYVGSGVLASAVAMDKSFAKPIFASNGLSVARGMVLTQQEWKSNQTEAMSRATELGFPLFVKPARSGSSRGTTKVKQADELSAAIEDALSHDPKVLIEVAVVGREIECGVLEINGSLHTSVVGEVRVLGNHEFYDFEAKYLDGSTEFDIPAKISESESAFVQAAAIKAFQALGCEGLARVDFFLTHDGSLIINEINTMPGFTPKSVFPMLWKAQGKSYTEIISILIESALHRRQHVVR